MTPEAYAASHFDKLAYSLALSALGIPKPLRGRYMAAHSISRSWLPEDKAKAKLSALDLPPDALDINPPEVGPITSFVDSPWRVFKATIAGTQFECLVIEDAYDVP